MSVINQMLRDLEHRPAQAPGLGVWKLGAPQASRLWAEGLPLSVRSGLLLLVLAGLAYLGQALWQQRTLAVEVVPALVANSVAGSSSELAASPVAASARTVSPTPPALTAAVAQPLAQLARIRVGVEAGRTRLVFEFSDQPRLARLAPLARQADSDSAQVSLWFDDTQVLGDLPALPYKDQLLAQAHLRQQGDAAVLELSPRAGIRLDVRQHQLHERAANPYWLVVDLRAAASAEAEPAPVAMAETPALENSAKADPVALAEPAAAPAPTPSTTGEWRKTPVAFSPAELAEQHYAAAMAALQRQDPAQAVTELDAALTQNPEHQAARQQRINLALNAGDKATAMQQLRSALGLEPAHLGFAKWLAQLLAEQGDYPGALQYLQAAAGAGRQDAHYLALLAAVEQQLGDHEAAIQAYVQALSFDRQQGVWWLGLGISLQQTGQSSAAADAYHEAQKSRRLNADLLAFVEQRLAQISPQAER